MNEQVCPGCRRHFLPYNNRQDVIFCCWTCRRSYLGRQRRNKSRKLRKAFKAKCPWCSKEFVPNSTNQTFCSEECRYKDGYNRKKAKALSTRTPVTCLICSKEFLPLRAINIKYCSTGCRQTAHKQKNKERSQKNPNKQKKYQSDYRKRNNEAVRKSRLKNWYGLSLEEYNAILKAQGNKCAICQEQLTRPHLDHDHGPSKAVRGILCGPCNFGLGNFRDRVKFLKSAIAYLRYHRSKRQQ